MDEFCDEHNVPKHLQEFLGLSGFYNVLDLTELTAKFVKEIEEMVRQRQFDNQVDFRLRENRMRYLGFDYTHLESFSFRLLDRMKLLRLSGLAKAKIAESGVKQESSTRGSSRKLPKASSDDMEEDKGDDDSWDEVPAKKKRKSQAYQQKDSARPERIANKVVTEVNSYLEEKDFESRIDRSQVSVSVEESGRLSVNVQCILCEPIKPIVLSANKYTAEINNWRRHMNFKHVGKKGIIL